MLRLSIIAVICVCCCLLQFSCTLAKAEQMSGKNSPDASDMIFSKRVEISGKQYIGFNLFMNFLDFIEYCHKNGMQPAEVNSREENIALTEYLDTNFAAPKYFWLGGTDIGREGRYYWIASLKEFSYTSWGSGYPNGYIFENCATIYGGDGTWYDQYCTNDGVQPLCQRIVL